LHGQIVGSKIVIKVPTNKIRTGGLIGSYNKCSK